MNSNDRSITTLTALSHALVHTYELSIPIFITVWLTEFSVGRATLGYLTMGGYALFGIGGVPSGIAADRFNSKTLLLLAITGMGISFLLIGFSPNMLFIGVAFCFWGVSASIHHPSSLSLISRAVKARGRGFAYHGMAGNFGIAFGPFLTSILLTFLEWRSVALCLAAPALAVGLLGSQLQVNERTNSDDDPSERELSVRSFSDFFERSYALMASVYGLLFLVVVFEGLYYRGILTFLPDFFQSLPQIPALKIGTLPLDTSKYLYSGMLMIGMAGQYIGGRLTDQFDPRRTLTVIFGLLSVLALLFIPIQSYSFVPIIALSSLTGLVLFTAQPLYQATIAENTPNQNRGLAYGFTFLAIFGVGAVGAGLSGYILTHYSPRILFATLAGLVLISMSLLLLIEWVKR